MRFFSDGKLDEKGKSAILRRFLPENGEKIAESHENGSKMPENGTKNAENGSKMPENGAKNTENRTKIPENAENGAKNGENGPRITENHSKMPDNSEKTPQNAPKMPEIAEFDGISNPAELKWAIAEKLMQMVYSEFQT
jgi:hypothetical protein